VKAARKVAIARRDAKGEHMKSNPRDLVTMSWDLKLCWKALSKQVQRKQKESMDQKSSPIARRGFGSALATV
jgi:hypothetical protein